MLLAAKIKAIRLKYLSACGIEETYCEIVLDIYQDSHFEVLCDEGLSKEFALKTGCKTGDPASPIFFILGIFTWTC